MIQIILLRRASHPLPIMIVDVLWGHRSSSACICSILEERGWKGAKFWRMVLVGGGVKTRGAGTMRVTKKAKLQNTTPIKIHQFQQLC